MHRFFLKPTSCYTTFYRLQVLPDQQNQISSASVQRVRWHPPPVAELKANFDGVVFRNDNRDGLGVVVRDH